MESQFVCDIKSLRSQCRESAHQELMEYAKRAKGNDGVFTAVCFSNSMMKNKVDTIYPKDDNCGEVVSMGTEETMACGLIVDQDERRLFGKYKEAPQFHSCVCEPNKTYPLSSLTYHFILLYFATNPCNR